MNTDFSLPSLPDGFPLNPFLKAKLNPVSANQTEAPDYLNPVGTQNLQTQPPSPPPLPRGSVRDARQVLATPTPRTLPQLSATLAMPTTVSFLDFINVYNKILPPDGSVLTHKELATMDLGKYQLTTKEAVILGAMMGNEQLFKQVDKYTPSKLTVIQEGISGVFRGSPSLQLKTGEIIASQSTFTGAGTTGSVAQSGTSATPALKIQPLIVEPQNKPQPLIAQVQNKTIASFVPSLGLPNPLLVNRTVENNANRLVVGANLSVPTGFTTPPITSSTTTVPFNLQRLLPYLATLPRSNTTVQEAFRLLLVAQLYGHLPLEAPEAKGESRDQALQRLAKVKAGQKILEPTEVKVNPLEALLPSWLLNAVNNAGMVDKKGAIHLKSGVLKELYVRARNQYAHEDIKFEELLSLQPANKEEERHLKFLKEAEVFHLLAHMERGGDNETMNLQDLEVAFSRHVLHTHFGHDDDETIIIDKEE